MSEMRERQIERRIAAIKRQVPKLGDLRPGTLTQQYKYPAQKQGAYYQLSYTHQMKSRTDYVRSESVATIRREVANYEKLRDLVKEWVELGIEASKLRLRQGKK